jgi:hypothetical protein
MSATNDVMPRRLSNFCARHICLPQRRCLCTAGHGGLPVLRCVYVAPYAPSRSTAPVVSRACAARSRQIVDSHCREFGTSVTFHIERRGFLHIQVVARFADAPNLLYYLKRCGFPGRITTLHMRPLPDEHTGTKACNHAHSRPTLRNGVHRIYLTAPLDAQAGAEVQIGLPPPRPRSPRRPLSLDDAPYMSDLVADDGAQSVCGRLLWHAAPGQPSH